MAQSPISFLLNMFPAHQVLRSQKQTYTQHDAFMYITVVATYHNRNNNLNFVIKVRHEASYPATLEHTKSARK